MKINLLALRAFTAAALCLSASLCQGGGIKLAGEADISAEDISAPNPAPSPPVIVEYIQPEKFTDISSSQYGPPNSSYLDQLSKHIAKQALTYLAAGQSLTISILDVDMAGAFEPWNTPGQDIRMIKHIYPPRISLRYQLRDAEGKVLKEGEERLSNPAYLLNLSPNSMDSVRHEKALIDDWLRRNFAQP